MVYLSNLAAISFGFSLFCFAQAFSFTHTDPTSCDDLTISWTGGTEPFYLSLIPVFGTPRNISIPSSSFSDGKGSFSTQLAFSENQKFLIAMSDQTGFASGGDTSVLQVGASKGGSCNTTDPGVSFSFELNSALTQCRTFTFSAYDNAIQPVQIIAMIPGGESVVLNPPQGPTSFDWTVNVFNGTQLLFLMMDAQGRPGGSSDVRTVSSSDDTSCINGNSPSSTAQPTASSTSTNSPGASPSESSSSSNKTPIGAIAGTVIGALVFLAVAITLGLFFLRRRQSRDHPEQRVQRHSRRMRSEVDLLATGPPPDPYPYSPYAGTMTPAINTPATQTFPSYNGSQPSDPFGSDAFSRSSVITSHTQHTQQPMSLSDHTTASHGMSPFTAGDSRSSQYSTPGQRKAAMAGVSNHKPSRYVMHTDMEDTPAVPEEDEVIELPPQYSERRMPQTGGSGSGSEGQWAGSSSSSTYPSGKQPFS
ncbi:hypothetical protein K435DRAFT_959773 [Dendrothele bispora CBS 962.96]|uniref:Mid2 domain-containing protein n=1 Tax=Dendrothele bispora (strain CBS 962.96) TaxID=1314807 RepID=A0A4S8MX93_DENBC|nr:hypothetical protein K435DRAFT_959773 [Dendrothele bispora CBS 962.96]